MCGEGKHKCVIVGKGGKKFCRFSPSVSLTQNKLTLFIFPFILGSHTYAWDIPPSMNKDCLNECMCNVFSIINYQIEDFYSYFVLYEVLGLIYHCTYHSIRKRSRLYESALPYYYGLIWDYCPMWQGWCNKNAGSHYQNSLEGNFLLR